MEKKDYSYKVVYDKIMTEIEKGVIPWRKTWKSINPMNGASKRKYRGINFLILGMSDFADPRWLTFKQMQEKGGNNKGQKATPVVFFTMWESPDKVNAKGEPVRIPFLRVYYVWNAEQITGIEFPSLFDSENEKVLSAEEVIANFKGGPKIVNSNSEAYYTRTKDEVHIPVLESFENSAMYYQGLFHELAHSAFASHRLDWEKGNTFGDEKYSENELICELASSFLCNACGISSDIALSASYIDGWSKYLRTADVKIFVRAANKAQKVADYILGNDPNANAELITDVTPEKELVPA